MKIDGVALASDLALEFVKSFSGNVPAKLAWKLSAHIEEIWQKMLQNKRLKV